MNAQLYMCMKWIRTTKDVLNNSITISAQRGDSSARLKFPLVQDWERKKAERPLGSEHSKSQLVAQCLVLIILEQWPWPKHCNLTPSEYSELRSASDGVSLDQSMSRTKKSKVSLLLQKLWADARGLILNTRRRLARERGENVYRHEVLKT